MQLDAHIKEYSNALESLSGKTSKNLSLFKPMLNNFNSKEFIFKQSISWHGLVVNLHLQSEFFLSEVKKYFPKSWLTNINSQFTSIDIYIFDDEKNGLTDDFWADEDPSCHLYEDKGIEWACQRDFLANKDGHQIIAVCKNSISDGFFNLMRWLLPRFWLSRNQFLFHSSCILNNKEEAYLCLGPSGAGKSTIAKFLPQAQVLGDDMNLLTIDERGKAWLTPSLLGQSYESNSLFGKSFPLKQIFFLAKADENKIIENKDLSLRLKICMSLVNIFWQNLSEDDFLAIQGLIFSLNNNYNIKELKFSLDKEVWDYVFREI